MTGALADALAAIELVAVEAGRRSAEIESARALPRDLMEALSESGAFRLAVPAEFGGHEADLATLLGAVGICSYHDGSTGWSVMSLALAGLDAARLPRHHARTVLGGRRSIVAGHRGRGGLARFTEDGGLLVSGRWPLAACVGASDWVGAGVSIVDDDGQPTTGPAGEEDLHILLRRDQVVVLDTWHALGLRGTGSTDFQATEAFVPEGRWLAGDANAPDGPALHRIAQRDLMAAGAAAVAAGLAIRAVDEVATAGPHSPDDGPRPLADRPVARVELARVGAEAEATRAQLERAVAAVDPSRPDRLVSASLSAIERAVTTIDRCHHLGGARTVLHASLLQRLLRDIHVIAQHPAASPARWEELGRLRFDHGR